MKNRASQKDKRDQAKRDTITSIVFLLLVAIGILIALLYNSGVFQEKLLGDRKVNMATQEVVVGIAELVPDIEESPNIAYPGYFSLSLKANKKMQAVYLHNPEENTCYFQISLTLEDGTTIWQSDYLEPGYAFNRIELSEALKKGTYENAVMKYNSYSIKDGHELNGSLIKLTLEVQ